MLFAALTILVGSDLINSLHVHACRVTAAHFVVTSGGLLVTGSGNIVVSGDPECIGDECKTDEPSFLTFDLGEGKLCAAGEGPQPTKPKPTKPKPTKPKPTKPKTTTTTTKIGNIALCMLWCFVTLATIASLSFYCYACHFTMLTCFVDGFQQC